jgi:hypothetical protein
MKRLIVTLGVIGAGLCSPAAAAAAECFASPAAVFAAHPHAAHASYTLRANKGSARCWYADAVTKEAKAKARTKGAPHHLARTSAPGPAIAAPPSYLRATAVAPAPWPRAAAAAPRAPPVTVLLPAEVPPAIEISVNVQELSRLLPVEDKPADFESRFSASGYRARK